MHRIFLVDSLSVSVTREKLFRLTQNSALLYSWLLQQSSWAPGDSAFWALVAKQTALVSRLNRLGKIIEALGLAAHIESPEAVIYYTSVLRQLSMVSYLGCDGIIALSNLNLYTVKNLQRVQREAARCWMGVILSSAIAQLYRLHSLQREAKEYDDPSGPRLIQRNISLLRLLSRVCDFTICARSLGVLDSGDGVVGACGVLSTIISMCIPKE